MLVAIRTVVVGANGVTRVNWMVVDESLVAQTTKILLQSKDVISVQCSSTFEMMPEVQDSVHAVRARNKGELL